jgi:hypothetical protein
MEFAPLAIGGLVQGIGSYLGGQAQAKAYKDAANQTNERWNKANEQAQPYITGGTNALNQYNTAMGLNGTEGQKEWASGLSSDPAFAASTKYGLDSLQARQAAQGMGQSGNESAALSDYSQKNLLGYQQQTLDNLFREGNLGANVATGSMSSSTGASNAVNNALAGYGSSVGSSYGALGNTAGNLGTSYTNYYYGQNKA